MFSIAPGFVYLCINNSPVLIMEEQDIKNRLAGVVHPETGEAIDVQKLTVSPLAVRFTIALKRARDPFASALKKQAIAAITDKFPGTEVTVFFEEPAPKARPEAKPLPEPGAIAGGACVVAVASGKGGVGKSTVTANLALALAGMGYRVGILDADIYGPSQGLLFGVGDYRPPVEHENGVDYMMPALAHGIKIMSIGFFIDPSDALVWRGPMATSALRQLIHQTRWGELDYLLLDMPPGTGDVHLTVLQEIKVAGAVVVTTPQQLAVADVVRGIAMFRAEKIGVKVLGIVENMAWFEPAETNGKRYYIFGEGGGRKLAEAQGVPLLAEIPLVLPAGTPLSTTRSGIVDNPVTKGEYHTLAQNIIKSLKC
jgi:ATP-binding protein involved in chromosome partitioning